MRLQTTCSLLYLLCRSYALFLAVFLLRGDPTLQPKVLSGVQAGKSTLRQSRNFGALVRLASKQYPWFPRVVRAQIQDGVLETYLPSQLFAVLPSTLPAKIRHGCYRRVERCLSQNGYGRPKKKSFFFRPPGSKIQTMFESWTPTVLYK